MTNPFLLQTDTPLFPKVLWNRPITKSASGRLLLVGGHAKEFQEIQSVYQLAVAAGIGQCTVVLPDSLRSLLGSFSDTYFVPTSPSGSIGRAAQAEILDLMTEADGVAIGASLSNNSETAVVVERLASEIKQSLIIYDEALTAISFNLSAVINNPRALLIVTMPELFKLAGKLNVPLAIRPERELLGRVEIVMAVASEMKASLVCVGKELIIISGDQVSVTPDISVRAHSAISAVLSVFWTQKPSHDSLTTAAWLLRQASKSLVQEETITSSRLRQALEQAFKNSDLS